MISDEFFTFLQYCGERFVIFLAVAQSAVDKRHKVDIGMEAELLVAGAEEVVVEHPAKSLFLQSHA